MTIRWDTVKNQHKIYVGDELLGSVKIKKNDFKNMTEMEASVSATDDANLWLGYHDYDLHVELYVHSIADELWAIWLAKTSVSRPYWSWPWWEQGDEGPPFVE
jgi:hypothetical protein